MTKLKLGIIGGVIAGVIDILPMVIQKLTWGANTSAFLLWVVSGFFIATTNIKVRGAIKGIVISFLVLLSPAVLIGWQEPLSLLPIFIMTLILGAGLGYCIDKFGK